ncbi:MAG: MBL fold metallo-hydrolase [Salinivirgaceae bacterium]|jgi:hydroxyacylglutathione hydrolase|nr:MBL fold metallo-hydrolase [Salinivirgaceae bacterium]
MQYKTFIFSPFQENAYLLYDETRECIVVDPGNFSSEENAQLDSFIKENNLILKAVVNTHNHLDHIFGLKYLIDTYKVDFVCDEKEIPYIDNFKASCQAYGLNIDYDPPQPTKLIKHADIYKFGNTEIEIISVPGHSAGGVALYNKKEGLLFCGDILFNNSIGRTDLPGGNHELLLSGIKERLFTLPEETEVFSGHGPKTTIGNEKWSNPFF